MLLHYSCFALSNSSLVPFVSLLLSFSSLDSSMGGGSPLRNANRSFRYFIAFAVTVSSDSSSPIDVQTFSNSSLIWFINCRFVFPATSNPNFDETFRSLASENYVNLLSQPRKLYTYPKSTNFSYSIFACHPGKVLHLLTHEEV